jgi:8-oxo-dGTP diphosphatase
MSAQKQDDSIQQQSSETNTVIRAAVGILTRFPQAGEVFMGQRRPDKAYPLQWEFPGGKVHNHESYVAALVRELHEELRIVVDPNDCACIHQEVNTYSTGTFDVRYYVVRSFIGEIINTEFHTVAWIPTLALPEYNMLSGNATIGALLHEHGVAHFLRSAWVA